MGEKYDVAKCAKGHLFILDDDHTDNYGMSACHCGESVYSVLGEAKITKRKYTNFGMTIYDLTMQQQVKVHNEMEVFQEMIQLKYKVDGGDFISADSDTFEC